MTRTMASHFALAFTVSCVTTPLQYSELQFGKTTPVDVSGYGANPNDTVMLQYSSPFGWATLATTTTSASNSASFGHPLHSYSFPSTVMPANGWVTDCGEERVTLRVIEQGVALGTFTQAGFDCIVTEMGNGSSPSSAGVTCHTGRTFSVSVPGPPC